MKRLITSLCLAFTAPPTHAGLVFDCPAYYCNFQLTAELVSSDGPTDTYRITTPNRTTMPTLADEVWAAGGTYELAAGADGFGRALDLYMWGATPGMWLWHSYQGGYIIPGSDDRMIGWIDLGTWHTTATAELSATRRIATTAVPEPSALALVVLGMLAAAWVVKRHD